MGAKRRRAETCEGLNEDVVPGETPFRLQGTRFLQRQVGPTRQDLQHPCTRTLPSTQGGASGSRRGRAEAHYTTTVCMNPDNLLLQGPECIYYFWQQGPSGTDRRTHGYCTRDFERDHLCFVVKRALPTNFCTAT